MSIIRYVGLVVLSVTIGIYLYESPDWMLWLGVLQLALLALGWYRIWKRVPVKHVYRSWVFFMIPKRFIGITIFEWAFYRYGPTHFGPDMTCWLESHEQRHAVQCRAVGYLLYYPIYILLYGWTLFRYGKLSYHNHPLEVDARRNECVCKYYRL